MRTILSRRKIGVHQGADALLLPITTLQLHRIRTEDSRICNTRQEVVGVHRSAEHI